MNPFAFISEKEVVELTQKLVRLESDWNTPTYEKAALDAICEFLEENNIPHETQVINEHRYNIIAFYKGNQRGKSLLLNGHIDTVPAYHMDFPSHEAFMEDGWIHGRGTNDMKGAVAAMLMVLVAFHRSNASFKGDIIVSVVCGEEEDSIGTKRLLTEGLKVDAAIVGEPSGFDYAIAHRGLEWLEIEIEGKTAHSGLADEAVNAISKAAKIIMALEQELEPKLKERTHPYTGRSILNFGKISGGDQPSTVAGNCSIQLDRRYVPGETPESVRKEIEEIIENLQKEDKDLKATVKLLAQDEDDPFYHVPLNTKGDDSIIPVLKAAVLEVTGSPPKLSTKRGWTDAGLLSFYGKIPTVVCGPGAIEYSHAQNEKIAISQLINAVNIYTKTAWAFCQSEQQPIENQVINNAD